MKDQIQRRFDRRGLKIKVIAFIAVTLLCFSALTYSPKPAWSQGCCSGVLPCWSVEALHDAHRSEIRRQHRRSKRHVRSVMEAHREDFIIGQLFREMILPAMQMMTEQLAVTAMHQTFIIGTFLDADEQLQTQLLTQELMAEAHKDYHPSVQLCSIGTMTKTLAQSQSRAYLSSHALGQHYLERQLRTSTETTIAKNIDNEKKFRITQFISRYCDIRDNNDTLNLLCRNNAPQRARNMDVNFTSLIDLPQTLPANFTNQALAGNANLREQDILTMSANLYGYEVFQPIPKTFLNKQPGADQEDADFAIVMDVRSIIAKRSVAQNSYNQIVGMKTSGGTGTSQNRLYMDKVIEQLGIEDATFAESYLGTQPSYHAQMELLTKTLYQRPDFFTNLYDKPANVDRTGAAIRAIGLMQGMDRYKSQLRNEMLLSVILETKLLEEHSGGVTQPSVQNSINKIGQ